MRLVSGLGLVLALASCRSDHAASPGARAGADADVGASARARAEAGLSEFECGEEHPSHARCGELEVLEARDQPEGRRLRLSYVVVPATGAAALPDPVVLFAGGPGQGATQATGLADTLLAGINEDRDLVFIDQRGTGESGALRCQADDLEGIVEGILAPGQREQLRACRDSYEADLTRYATTTAMADIDELRAALGYETLNLFGISYGTRAALEYLRRYEDHTRSVALWGVAGPGVSFLPPFVEATEHALDRLFLDCEADPTCGPRWPLGREAFDATRARLAAAPASIEVLDPRSGQLEPLRFDANLFVTAVRLVLYDAGWTAELPAMLAAAHAEDYQPLANFLARFAVLVAGEVALGMHLAVVCSEDIPLMSEADFQAGAESVLGSEAFGEYVEPCAMWPRAELPSDWSEPVRGDVPVLLLGGELDPATPLSSAHAAAASLANARVVGFPNTSHGMSNADACVNELLREFIAAPAPAQLDLSCTESIERPPFVGLN